MKTKVSPSTILIILPTLMLLACSSVKTIPSAGYENELLNTRKYIGEFIEYSHTGPEVFGGVNLIWIRTTMFNTYGRLSAYGSKCNFQEGERIYLKRMYSTPGAYGNWLYQIENDSSVIYRVSEYKYENNVLVKACF
ncbi:MAG: hypothetical protein RBT38_11745 [Bacteroidales bacterium]|jgi:hypothetical protein|nr:hypothetical protein [Bacteroidales bacterium]